MNAHLNAAVPAFAATAPQPSALNLLIQRLVRREDLSRMEASALLNAMLADDATDVEIAAALTALAQKGETSTELAGMTEAMRARMVPLRCEMSRVIDTAGTGASRAKTFNVSTAASFVIAAAGLPVAKHGARASTSNSGSADVLKALGCDIELEPEHSAQLLEQHGLCFLFAPQYHPAAARVAPIRRRLGFRTIFNLIGPLSSPSRTRFQLVGVGDEKLLFKMAEALAQLGCERAFVVHGDDGLDEVSVAGGTTVAHVAGGAVSTTNLQPEDFGVKRAACVDLRVADAQASAEQIEAVLSGRGDQRARDLTVLNAAAALMVGLELGARAAADLARQALQSGAALSKLETLRNAAKGAKA